MLQLYLRDGVTYLISTWVVGDGLTSKRRSEEITAREYTHIKVSYTY